MRFATLFADRDFDDWPTPEKEAENIGTGSLNNWPTFAGSFEVQVGSKEQALPGTTKIMTRIHKNANETQKS
jgi:hypothetical protein